MVNTLDLDLIERSIDPETLKRYEQKCMKCNSWPKPIIAVDELGNRFIRVQCDRCERILINERINKSITPDSEICTPAKLMSLTSFELDIPETGRKVQIFWKHRGYLVPVKWEDRTDILIFEKKVEIEGHIRLWFKHPTSSGLTYNIPTIDHYWKYARKEVES